MATFRVIHTHEKQRKPARNGIKAEITGMSLRFKKPYIDRLSGVQSVWISSKLSIKSCSFI
ncbi:MAG: hypothetical protein MI976_07805 [Pseudomonadales bacterium]|nr:hypothetical protein [Pseudomonadales bacterium]